MRTLETLWVPLFLNMLQHVLESQEVLEGGKSWSLKVVRLITQDPYFSKVLLCVCTGQLSRTKYHVDFRELPSS